MYQSPAIAIMYQSPAIAIMYQSPAIAIIAMYVPGPSYSYHVPEPGGGFTPVKLTSAQFLKKTILKNESCEAPPSLDQCLVMSSLI